MPSKWSNWKIRFRTKFGGISHSKGFLKTKLNEKWHFNQIEIRMSSLFACLMSIFRRNFHLWPWNKLFFHPTRHFEADPRKKTEATLSWLHLMLSLFPQNVIAIAIGKAERKILVPHFLLPSSLPSFISLRNICTWFAVLGCELCKTTPFHFVAYHLITKVNDKPTDLIRTLFHLFFAVRVNFWLINNYSNQAYERKLRNQTCSSNENFFLFHSKMICIFFCPKTGRNLFNLE